MTTSRSMQYILATCLCLAGVWPSATALGQQAAPPQDPTTTAPAPVAPAAATEATIVPQDTAPQPVAAQGATSDSPPSTPADLLPTAAPVVAGAGGLSAQEAAARAVARAPSVQAADAALLRAEQVSEEAYWAGLPGLLLSASYTRLSEVEMGFSSANLQNSGLPPALASSFGAFTNQVLNQYALKATLNARVSDFILSMLPAYHASEHMQSAASYQREAAKDTVAYRTEIAYHQLARARAATQVATDSVALVERNIADLQALHAAGMVANPDLALARAELASAQLAVGQSQAAVHVAEANLRTLLGLPEDAPVDLSEALESNSSAQAPAMKDLLSLAQDKRAELLALRAALAAAQEVTNSQEGRRYPSLSVFASADYSNPQPRSIPVQDKFRPAWAAGVVLSWSPTDIPLWNSRVGQAQQDEARAMANIEAMEEGLRMEAAAALSGFQTAKEAVTAAEAGVAAAQENYAARHDLMNAGAETLINVMDAQARLRQAQLRLIEAHIQTKLSAVEIRRVAGVLRDTDATPILRSPS